MTTPAPQRTSGRRKHTERRTAAERGGQQRPVMRLGITGWVISWLMPTALTGGALLGVSFLPGLNDTGFVAPLVPLIGGAAVVIGIPGTLVIGWLFRYQLNVLVHILGYALVGLLYGPVVLFAGASGLVPMLIPLVGFPAALFLAVGRWIAQPLARIDSPEGDSP